MNGECGRCRDEVVLFETFTRDGEYMRVCEGCAIDLYVEGLSDVQPRPEQPPPRIGEYIS